MKTKLYSVVFSALLALTLSAATVQSAFAGGNIQVPSPLFLDCFDNAESEISFWLNDYYIDSGCDVISVTNDYVPQAIDFCTSQTITVTWTALTNNCGTMFGSSTIIIVPDQTPPQLDVPPGLSFDCDNPPNDITGWLNSANGYDDCFGNVTITNDYVGPVPSVCVGGYLTVTWTATDACGNTAQNWRDIDVYPDTDPPYIDVPFDLELDCDDQPFYVDGWLNSANAYDVCPGQVTLINDYVGPLPSICDGGTINVTWTATDGCGNSAQNFSWIEVDGDYSAPYLSAPSPTFADCEMNINGYFSSWLNSAYTDDDCPGTVDLTNDYSGTLPDVCSGGSVYVTWTATDGCGNSAQSSSNFDIEEDDEDPTIICAANATRPCYNNVVFDSPSADDNCGNATVSEVSTTVNPGSSGTYVHCRTWIATDDCGNTSQTCQQCITTPSPLTVDAGPNKIVYLGYPDSSCTKLQSSGIGGGAAPYTRVWSTAGNSNLGTGTFINVCPTTTRVYYLTITDANGCTATDSVKVCVIDVRCGNAMNNVLVCHGTGSATNPYITICTDLAGAKWHLKKHAGEQLGTCGMNKSCTFPVETRMDAFNYGTIEEDIEFIGAFPNPFTGSTTVRFMLPQNDFASVKVTDVTGRIIENLYEGETEAGNIYAVTFEGASHARGMYFLVMQTRSGVMETQKLILEK